MFFVVGNSLQRSNKTNVLSEKFDSIKYQNQRSAKLICDPKNIPINQQQEASGLKILIFNSGRLQISRHISLVGIIPLAGKQRIMLCLTFYFLSRSIKATRLMFCRICYPTASNIRICDPKNIPINQQQEASGLKKSLYSVPAD